MNNFTHEFIKSIIQKISVDYNLDFKELQVKYFQDGENLSDNYMLIKQPNVIRWLKGDLGFLPCFTSKNKTLDTKNFKILEDKWGVEMLKLKRPDLKINNQWTGQFGEEICKEVFSLSGKLIKKPVKMNHYKPDFETDDYMLEVKTETYYTEGTAGEKILGVPFKYSEIPELYKKPLKIICIGGAEKSCREQYGILPGEKCTEIKRKFLDFYREHKMEYYAFTDFVQGLHSPEIQDFLNLLSGDTTTP